MAIQQDWCAGHKIQDVLNRHGQFKKTGEFPQSRMPVYFEVAELESTMRDFVSSSQYSCGRTHEGCLRKMETEMLNYNAYGRIIYRKISGYSYFYKLLSFEEKNAARRRKTYQFFFVI